MKTAHFPHSPRPPQAVFRIIPACPAASRRVAPPCIFSVTASGLKVTVECFILADGRQTGQITGLLVYELILLRVFQRARRFLLPIFLLRLGFAIGIS